MLDYKRPIAVFTILIFAVSLLMVYDRETMPVSGVNVTQSDSRKLCILMYHGFTKSGKETEFVLNIGKFENDIIYLKENGFSFITTAELISYLSGRGDLPEKPVLICIDDGNLNNYTICYPIAKKHGVKLCISPIAYYVDYYSTHEEKNPKYSQMGEKEIREMHESGIAEIQNHSYNMHSLTKRKGSSKMKGESVDEYMRVFYYDLKKAENIICEITGKQPTTYVYPYGAISPESRGILKSCGYYLSFGCAEGYNYIKKGGGKMYNMKRFNRSNQKSAKQILSDY